MMEGSLWSVNMTYRPTMIPGLLTSRTVPLGQVLVVDLPSMDCARAQASVPQSGSPTKCMGEFELKRG